MGFTHHANLIKESGTHSTNGLWAYTSNLENILHALKFHYNDPIRLQFCTCHDSWAVVACAKLPPDWIIIFSRKPTPISNEIWIMSSWAICEIIPSVWLYFPHCCRGVWVIATRLNSQKRGSSADGWLGIYSRADSYSCCLFSFASAVFVILLVRSIALTPLCADFYSGNVKTYWLFLLFHDNKMEQVVEIMACGNEGPIHPSQPILWLVTAWWRKEPGH